MLSGSPLRAGIIGGGFIAEVHSRAVRAAGHEVAGISTSSRASSRAAARRLGARQSFDSAADLIASPEIDVIHICTPNDLHAEFSLAAIAAGKPVVCEKPLATTLSDALMLTEAARAGGVQTAVPFAYRYYPTIREIRSRIQANEAGNLLLLHGSYLQDWLAEPLSTNWRVDPAKGGVSRAFADIGVHWCDLMEFVTGHRIVRIAANLTTSYPNRGGSGLSSPVGTEDVATVLFETDQAAAGSLTVSQISRGRKNRLWFSFDGTEGSYQFNQETPNELWIGGTDESRTIVSGTAGLRGEDARRFAVLPAGHPQGYQDAFNAFVEEAYREFAGESVTGLPTFEDGCRAAAITEAVVTASTTRTWVDVPSQRVPPSLSSAN